MIADPDAVLGAAVRLGVTVAPDVVGCSVTQRAGGGYRTPVSSNALACTLDEAQYEAGAGPCMTATTGTEQRVDAFATDPRYPGLAAVAERHGVRSSLSLPLAGGPRPTALNLYAAAPGAFVPQRPRLVARLLARCMAAVLDAGTVPPAASSVELAGALARRRLVRAAEDVLMVTGRVSRAEAFRRLVDRSMQERRGVAEAAAAVLRDAGPEATR